MADDVLFYFIFCIPITYVMFLLLLWWNMEKKCICMHVRRYVQIYFCRYLDLSICTYIYRCFPKERNGKTENWKAKEYMRDVFIHHAWWHFPPLSPPVFLFFIFVFLLSLQKRWERDLDELSGKMEVGGWALLVMVFFFWCHSAGIASPTYHITPSLFIYFSLCIFLYIIFM